MLTLAYPILLLLLPLPLLVRKLAPPLQHRQSAIRVPFLAQLSRLTGQRPHSGAAVPRGGKWQKLLVWLIWVLVVAALTRPQWIEQPLRRELPMRDLMLAIDLSGSMETRDFVDASDATIDRLTAVKQVLEDFLDQRQGDRVGLIFFGSAAFLQVPFTEDIHLCQQLLDEAQVRMAGPKTAFGDAIGLAIEHFEKSTMQQKVLLVLTDGNDTASQVPPRKAASIAAKNGITIYTIGIGDPESVGEEAFDEDALKAVAEVSQGQYFFAQDGQQLQQITQTIEALEPQQVDTQTYRPKIELFYLPLVLVLALSILFHGAKVAGQSRAPSTSAKHEATADHARV